MQLEILDKNSFDKWESAIKKLPENKRSIHILPQYYQTWINYENAEAFCFLAHFDNYFLLYPFFKKEITEFSLGETYYDIFTAYGYGGVITNSDHCISPVDLYTFNSAVTKWLKEQNVITEFIRESPAYSNKIRNADYVIVRQNTTVFGMDTYHLNCKNTRRNIQKAEEFGLYAKIDEEMHSLDEFIQMYYQTARRQHFDDFYFFSIEYFYNIKSYLKDHAFIFKIKNKSGKTIAALLIFKYARNACFHLACSDFEEGNFYQNDFLFKSAIEYCIQQNAGYICLGGGTSTSEDDSLLRFKKKFGNLILDVYVGKKIINKEKYDEIIMLWEQKYPHLKDKYRNFFQRYRLSS